MSAHAHTSILEIHKLQTRIKHKPMLLFHFWSVVFPFQQSKISSILGFVIFIFISYQHFTQENSENVTLCWNKIRYGTQEREREVEAHNKTTIKRIFR